ncbi:hypothetical protein BO71DRAFT_225915 [Aspergillus ellipticus CBS 707.79]|uniref:Uncharacterized protein n=1 Tax=Aspergillus ellipticus CBS 707.79 TaxID=1448320 RepID=A0A319DB09_9EURO|nr:hypothetical protein BO71DRAFT_225915 [Aspergillus ellipticus CBS 707.79]
MKLMQIGCNGCTTTRRLVLKAVRCPCWPPSTSTYFRPAIIPGLLWLTRLGSHHPRPLSPPCTTCMVGQPRRPILHQACLGVWSAPRLRLPAIRRVATTREVKRVRPVWGSSHGLTDVR